MTTHRVDSEVTVAVTVRDGSDAITRVTGEGGDEWRAQLYNLHTQEDVLRHWAYNAIANGVEDASRLDGWADLAPGTVTLDIEVIEVGP